MAERSIETLSLDGGRLCLNFTNTICDRKKEPLHFDYLSSYSNLLEWSVKVDLLTQNESEKLQAIAHNNKEEAENALESVNRARATLYRYFFAIAKNEIPGKDIQKAFNALFKEVMTKMELRIEKNLEVHEQWKNKTALNYPLYPIVKSAYDLLISGNLDRVKECGACGWLFFDQSKNKSRKWCSMESCGSIVKAKRYYHKNKKNS